MVKSLVLAGPVHALPEAGRQGVRERAAKVRAEGMADVAEAVLKGATSGDTKANNPVATAFVRELLMRQDADGYARTCEALAAAKAADLERIGCRVLLVTGDEDAVAPPSGGAQHGRPAARRARDRALALRALDHDRARQRSEPGFQGVSFRTPLTGHGRAARRGTAPEPLKETAMANVLFTNVRIIDGTGAQPFTGEVLVQGNRIPRVARGVRTAAHGGRDRHRRRRRHADAGHGARPTRTSAGPIRRTLDAIAEAAARGAHALGGAGGEALPRPRLDLVRRRRHAQAAPRLRDPQRHQLGPDPGAALPRGQPGDHRHRLARRRHAAAPAVPGDVVRLRGRRARGDAQGGAHVPQVRRRLDQAQPVGRQPGAGRRRAARPG